MTAHLLENGVNLHFKTKWHSSKMQQLLKNGDNTVMTCVNDLFKKTQKTLERHE